MGLDKYIWLLITAKCVLEKLKDSLLPVFSGWVQVPNMLNSWSVHPSRSGFPGRLQRGLAGWHGKVCFPHLAPPAIPDDERRPTGEMAGTTGPGSHFLKKKRQNKPNGLFVNVISGCLGPWWPAVGLWSYAAGVKRTSGTDAGTVSRLNPAICLVLKQLNYVILSLYSTESTVK